MAKELDEKWERLRGSVERKLIWGENVEEVSAWLESKDVPEEVIKELVASGQRSREGQGRRLALVLMVLGALLVTGGSLFLPKASVSASPPPLLLPAALGLMFMGCMVMILGLFRLLSSDGGGSTSEWED